MTTGVIISDSRPPTSSPHRRSVRRLGVVEAGRFLRSPSMWIGFAVSILLTALNFRAGEGKWSGDTYTNAIPVDFLPLLLGVLIAGIRAGGRDQSIDRPGLAEEAPLDRDDRAVARLAGLIVPVTLGALVVATVAVASRIAGGFWVGDFPRRTDTALHSFAEMLQPLLLVALFGAAGVAAGSRTKRSAPVIVAGTVIWFAACMVYWAWQSNGVHVLALLQTQPMPIDLPVGTDPGSLPVDWLAAAPNEFEGSWQREIVHLPTVWWHNVYLLGLTALCCGLALGRTLRRSVLPIGLAVAAAGVVGQVVVSPF